MNQPLPPRVLLVDDQPANLLALEAVLGDLGLDLVRAGSGDEALKRLLDADFAAVLLDVQMPGVGGFEVARLMRARPRTRATPVLFVTAEEHDADTVAEAYQLGAVDFLVKPLVPEAVRAKVGALAELDREKERARREADHFRLLVQGTTDYAIFMLDPQGRVATWNTGAERLKGYTAADIVGQHFSTFYPREAKDRGWPAEGLRRAAADGRVEDEGWRVRKDGSRFWANVVITALRDAHGSLRGFSKVTRDLTERRDREEALRRLNDDLERRVEERTAELTAAYAALRTKEVELTDFVENATVGLHWVGPDGTILWANRAELGLLGYARDEYVGRNIAEFHADPPVIADILCRLTNGEELHSYEARLRRKDGAVVHVLISSNVYREGGAFRHTRCFTRDITGRKRAEEALRRSEGRLRLLDAVGEATRGVEDARAVMREAARVLGEHLGATRCAYADVDPDGDRFTIRDDWAAPGVATSAGVYSLARFGPRAVAELTAGRPLVLRDVDRELAPDGGGAMFTAIGIKAIVCYPLVKGGRLAAMMAVHQGAPRDWTGDEVGLVGEVVERSWAHVERVRSADALREANRRKDEFLATLAHELRNPLAPLRNAVAVLRMGPPPGESGRLVAMMERQLGQLVHLVDDLMDVSRVTSGKVALRPERLDLREVVDAAVETTRPAAECAGHTLVVRLPDGPLPVTGDRTRLAQVFTNLLNNACKYTPPGGRIELAAGPDGGAALVRVADTGVGIPGDMLPKVFEVFTQVDRSLDRAQGGLGLGLALVKTLVEMHGGEVGAESPGADQGSTFSVRLPLAAGTGE